MNSKIDIANATVSLLTLNTVLNNVECEQLLLGIQHLCEDKTTLSLLLKAMKSKVMKICIAADEVEEEGIQWELKKQSRELPRLLHNMMGLENVGQRRSTEVIIKIIHTDIF